jgi:cellulose biosynthesis protein BcsQ
MSKIIMFGGQKGGVGKTAVTVMAATALSQEPCNLRTVVIDLDNQKSVIRARKLDLKAYQTDVAPFDVFSYSIAELQENIKRLDKDYQLIFIDVAGKMDNTQPIETQEITKALMYVDCLFIPFVAGNYNLESTVDYFNFIRQVQNIRALQSRNLQAFGFANLHKARSKANALLSEDLEILKESENLKMLVNGLNDYSLFRDADTITSLYDPLSTNIAKHNFSSFINELIKIITA